MDYKGEKSRTTSTGLRVTAVGVGTSVIDPARRGSCVLVEAGNVKVAADLGLGSLHGLASLGIAPLELDAVVLTHLHPDHTAELVSLLFASNYSENPRIKPLLLVGGRGVGDHLAELFRLYGNWVVPKHYELEVRELSEGDEFAVDSLTITVGPAAHIPSSLSYRFGVSTVSAVLTGDTGPCAELTRFSRGADLLVAEASLAEGETVEGHLNARQAGELAADASVTKLALVHCYPRVLEDDPAARARELFDGEVTLAEDSMELFSV